MNSGDLLQWLWEATLAVSAAIALVLLLRQPMRRHFGASVAYACWLLVPALLVAISLPAMHGSGVGAEVLTLPVPTSADLADTGSSVRTAQGFGPFFWGSAALWLIAAWGVGVLAMLGRMALQQHAFQRHLGSLQRRHDDLLQADCDAGLPAVVGVWRSRIVVPRDFDHRFDPQERHVMLVHERSHIDARDLHANALAALLRCLFWFHPLAHYAGARFRQDQEMACDARVIRAHPASRRVYAQAMLKAQLACMPLPIGCHWAPIHPIKERIQMLKQSLPGTTRWLSGSVLTALLTLGAGATAWSGQPAAAASSIAMASIPQGSVNISVSTLDPDMPAVWQKTLPLNQPFSFQLRQFGELWDVDGIATQSPDPGIVTLSLTYAKNGAVVNAA